MAQMAQLAMAANGRGIIHEVTGKARGGVLPVRCGRPGVVLRVARTAPGDDGLLAVTLADGTAAEGRMCRKCTHRKDAGHKTSFWLSRVLGERVEHVRAMTGYSYAQVMEHGVVTIEFELKAIQQEAATRARHCTCEARYPNGHCKRCYGLPPRFAVPKTPALVPGALFRGASR